jgi:hypothetical protein
MLKNKLKNIILKFANFINNFSYVQYDYGEELEDVINNHENKNP